MGILAAATHHEFTDAMVRIGFAVRILRGEALIIVIVAVNDNVGTSAIEDLPKRFKFRISAVGQARTEQRAMKIGESTTGRMFSKIFRQPLPLP